MNTIVRTFVVLLFGVALVGLVSTACADETLTTATVMESLQESDWREPDPAELLYMQIAHGTVVMELAPGFAPLNVANIKTLVKEGYFDGLAIIRSQDNYVVQWGDPAKDDDARSFGSATSTVAPEFVRSVEGISISNVKSRDAYADMVGFADGFPVGSDGERAWLTHCYGMLGVARSNAADSGNGSSLYVITGHAPRQLDRNITLAGRVLSGIEHLTTLPRGTGQRGFYQTEDERTPILDVRLGTDVADGERLKLEVLRTDTDAFNDYVLSQTFRNEEWFFDPTGRIEICNINPPVRIIE